MIAAAAGARSADDGITAVFTSELPVRPGRLSGPAAGHSRCRGSDYFWLVFGSGGHVDLQILGLGPVTCMRFTRV